MSLLTAYLFLFSGGFLLFVGGEALVSGSKRMAAAFGVSPLLIGLTVVAFGTSAPELSVSLNAALSGSVDIALGNVVGSNICNILLVLGLCAVVAPLSVQDVLVKLDVPVMVVASLLFYLLAFDLMVARADAIILLVIFASYLGLLFFLAQKNRPVFVEGEIEEIDTRYLLHTVYIVVGLVGLVGGASLFIQGASTIALSLGISDRLIGLTVVAFGTSLPEIVTSVVATYRGERDIAVGNIFGSNIFNTFLVVGTTAAIHPLPVVADMVYLDMLVMLAAAFVCFPIIWDRVISRKEGLFLLSGYFVYVYFIIAAQFVPAS